MLTQTLSEEALSVLPGGVNSPVRALRGLGVSPLFVKSGKGSRIVDVEGREFIDFCCGWGSLLLGHAHPAVVEAVQRQVALGSSFGITTEWEVLLAKEIARRMPSLEKLRFVSSGTEATMTALRLARGFTGKNRIVKFAGHYHGHVDSLLVQAGSGALSLNAEATSLGVSPAVAQETTVLPFNRKEALLSFFQTDPRAKEVAAVIVEPVAGNMGVVPPEPGFLAALREETKKAGALLLFDEVITGFRVGPQGAQGLYGIEPDLTCLGKIIGAGFPAAAVGGKEEIMGMLAPLGGVYQAGTLSGNPIAMRAGLVALGEIDSSLYASLEERASFFCGRIQEKIQKSGILACVQRVGSMFTIFFGREKVSEKQPLDEPAFAALFRHCLAAGVYLSPSAYEANFLSSAHTDEDLEKSLNAILSFFKIL